MEMHVRDAGPFDAEAIARILTQSWQAAYRGLVPDGYLDALTWRDRLPLWTSVLSRMGAGPHRVFVAAAGHAQVGFASVGPSSDPDAGPAWQLYSIYLLPHVVRNRVGTALLEAAMDATPQGVPVTLWVLGGNRRGRSFYEAHAFTEDGMSRTENIGGRELLELRYLRQPGMPSVER